MRLVDLSPEWVEGGKGIKFLCPKHRDHSLTVYFANPIGTRGTQPYGGEKDAFLWQRVGETFDTLTLAPNINAGCWRGFIQKGEIKNV
jgi:hypothetical protein